MKSGRSEHIFDSLPEYVSGTLDSEDKRRAREHLVDCSACREELGAWQEIHEAVNLDSSRVPGPSADLMERVWVRIEEDAQATVQPSLTSRLSLALQILVGQLPLVKKKIWVASAVTMAFGAAVSLLTYVSVTATGTTFALFAPIVAAVGVALVYGPENDPSLEVALSTPTRPRLILLARLTLVYGYDLALALAATAVFTAVNGALDMWPLVSLWIGPMLFLSALALLISLFFGPTPAIFTAMALWSVRLAATAGSDPTYLDSAWMRAVEALWQANAVLLPLAVLLLATAFFYAPRRVGPSQGWAD